MVGRTSVEKKSGGDGGAYSTFRFTDETDENVGNATDHTACRHDTTETHGAYNEPNGIHHASHSPGGDERIDFVCEKLNVSKRTLQTYRDGGLLAYSQINHKIYYRLEDVEAFITAMSRELIEEE